MTMRELLNQSNKRNRLQLRLRKDLRLAKRRPRNPSKRILLTLEILKTLLPVNQKVEEPEEVVETTEEEENIEEEVKEEEEVNSEEEEKAEEKEEENTEEEVKVEEKEDQDLKLKVEKLRELKNSLEKEEKVNTDQEAHTEEEAKAEVNIDQEERAVEAEEEEKVEAEEEAEEEVIDKLKMKKEPIRKSMKELYLKLTSKKTENMMIITIIKSFKVIQEKSIPSIESQELEEEQDFLRMAMERATGESQKMN
jgi:hypothetical protein